MPHSVCFVLGLGLLLGGMAVLCRALRRGGLPAVPAAPLPAFRQGLAATVLLQSSSAVSCMLVALADGGALALPTALAALCGVNLGAAANCWLFCLSGFRLPFWLPPLFWGAVGLAGLLRKKPLLPGIGCLFLGLHLMAAAAAPLAADPRAAALLARCARPAAGLALGAVFAGILQSSGAGMGALTALAGAGVLPRRAAAWLVMGLNLGTCSTAFMAAATAGKQGKRVPLLHLGLNLAAAAAVGPFLLAFPPDGMARPWETVLFHTLFNAAMPMVILPVLTRLTAPRKQIMLYNS